MSKAEQDYLERIQRATTRFEAADLIRANATRVASGLRNCYTSDQIATIVFDAESRASGLERDFAEDEHSDPVPESRHPWRHWLRKWGYLPAAEPWSCPLCGSDCAGECEAGRRGALGDW